MKNLIMLDVRFALECDDEFAEKLKDESWVKQVVLRNCFKNNTRRIMDARIIDEEILDGRISTIKLLDSRYPHGSSLPANEQEEIDGPDATFDFEVTLP